MLAHTLERLASWGVTEVAVNVHTLADHLVETLPECTPKGMKTVISFEPEILGTGGGLKRLEWFWSDEPVWICNVDVMAELDPAPLLKAFAEEDPLACLWMVPDAGPKTVRVENGYVVDFRGGGMTFSGLHLASPRLLYYLPEEEGFCSVIPAYEQGMVRGEKVCGVTVPDSTWRDIGTPEQLLKANEGSVVFPGAEVGPEVTLNQAVIGTGVRISGRRSVTGLQVSSRRGLSAEERKWFLPARAGARRWSGKVGRVEMLPFRGSDRRYRRVIFRNESSVILAVSGESRPENFRVPAHTRALAAQGVRVPKVLSRKNQDRVLILEDVGRVHLLDRLREGSAKRNRQDMGNVIDLVARLHEARPPKDLEVPFTAEVVKWEHDLFIEQFLDRLDADADREALAQAFARNGRKFLKQDQVLVHRDLQATNLLWHRGEPVLIDFQGMRLGPAAYDLASLFADPYVDRPRDLQLELLEQYNLVARVPVSEAAYRVGALQRLAQALGAYGRLGHLPGTETFLNHIPAGVRQLGLWSEDPVIREWCGDFSERHPTANTLGVRCE
jgi:aminoglycoside/choline kinase family phosphotransferase